MSQQETFEIWIKITVLHEYYNSGNIPISLAPTVTSRALMQNHGILLRATGPGKWILLRLTGELARRQYEMLAQEDAILQFELRPSAEEFFYSTSEESLQSVNENYSLIVTAQPGVWRILEVPVKSIICETCITELITLKCPRKKLEFIMIAKYNSENANLRVDEDMGRIIFGGIETRYMHDGTRVYTVISSTEVLLQKSCPYKIRLWETKPSGDRLLCGALPLPGYDEISTIGGKDAITTYFYY